MSVLFPLDNQRLNQEVITIHPPLQVNCSDPSLLPCGYYFLEKLKKKGFHPDFRKGENLATTVRFSFLPNGQRGFKMRISLNRPGYLLDFFGENLASNYYAVHSFLQNCQIKTHCLQTKLQSFSGSPGCYHRNLIISLSWMENLIEFPFFGLKKWQEFVDLLSEWRFTRIDFMQWGCSLPPPPSQAINAQDEWAAWQVTSPTGGSWPIPEAYRGLTYQEQGWKTQLLFQPWLFPLTGKTINQSAEFSVCLPPVAKFPLSRWDTQQKKIIRCLWSPPFIKNKGLFRKVVDYIHRRGMQAGLFTTPRVPCVIREKEFWNFWAEIIEYFAAQGVDSFLFETEEGPLSFQHQQQCSACQKTWGDIFFGYTRKVARQTEILSEVINSCCPGKNTGWILHVPLHAGYGNPPERKEWLKNPSAYRENLKLFRKQAPDDFTLDYLPYPGDHGINHQFLPKIYLDIFGPSRIRPTGYTHAWGPVRSFRGLEPYYLAIAQSLWGYDNVRENFIWKEEIPEKIIACFSKQFYGSGKALFFLARYSLNNRRQLFGQNSLVSPLVWDRASFCIGEQVLKKMLLAASKEKRQSYLPYPVSAYRKALAGVRAAEKYLARVRLVSYHSFSNWDFREGFEERRALVKASRYALEFCLAYDRLLGQISEKQPVRRKALEKLVNLGIKINQAVGFSYRSQFWPSSSRLAGLYDYYAFACFLMKHPEVLLTRKTR
ncbi:MAG: hypothetical protein NC911_00065 [Candidatus Omnitrophica bacterium]|nr:hypothetical protein [Candidatus Omnitrophota bacterium]